MVGLQMLILYNFLVLILYLFGVFSFFSFSQVTRIYYVADVCIIVIIYYVERTIVN